MTASEASAALRDELAAAQAAAEAGDAAVLQAAVDRCVELCTRIDAGGCIPPARELRDLAELHRRVLARALAHHAYLRGALERAGRSRRATSAYTGR